MWPIAFQFGSFVIGSYGLAMVLAIWATLWLCAHLGRRDGLPTKKLNDLGVLILITGVIGAKALDTLVTSLNAGHLIVTDLRSAGAIHGGLIAGTITLIVATRRFGMPLMAVLECSAPAITIGQAIGRIGCFLSGCCFGHQTDGPFAVIYSNPITTRISGAPLNVPVHPVQLYDAAAHFALTIVLVLMHKKRVFEGRLFFVWCALEGLTRFGMETFRGDLGRGVWAAGLSTGRLTALSFLLVGLVGFFVTPRFRKVQAPS